MARWLLTRLGRGKKLEPLHLGAQGHHHHYEWGLKWCGFQRRLEAQEWLRGIWRLSSQVEVKVQAKEAKLTTWSFVAQVPHKLMVAKNFNSSIM